MVDPVKKYVRKKMSPSSFINITTHNTLKIMVKFHYFTFVINKCTYYNCDVNFVLNGLVAVPTPGMPSLTFHCKFFIFELYSTWSSDSSRPCYCCTITITTNVL